MNNGCSPSKALEISKLDEKTQKEVLKDADNFSRDDIKKIREEKLSKEIESSSGYIKQDITVIIHEKEKEI